MDGWSYKALGNDERLIQAWSVSGMHAFSNDPATITEYLQRLNREEWLRVLVDENDELVGTLARTPIGMFINHGRVSAEAVGFVTVPPMHRGKRASVHLMHEHLREANACGAALSVLYSARARLYRGVGYECAGRRSEIELPIRTLKARSAEGVEEITVREMTSGDRAEMERVYSAFAEKMNGYIERSEWFWEYMLGGYAKNRRPGFVFERDGEMTGYVVLTHGERIGPKQGGTMTMHDIVFSDAQTARAIVRFIAGFASTRGSITLGGDSSHPFFDHIDEMWYRVVHTENWLIRIVDVQRALEERGYNSSLAGEVVIGIEDPLMDQNSGTWRLTIENGKGTAERTEDEAHVSMGVDALSPIYTGYMSATQMLLNARISGDPESVRLLDGLMSAATPTMTDEF